MGDALIYFNAHDRVITPSDKVGYVKSQAGDRVTGVYVNSVADDGAEFEIAARMLVSWPPHTDRPSPVRIK